MCPGDAGKAIGGERAKERPRNRWMNNVTNNLEDLQVRDWKEKTKNRKE